jgi:hypothetical protein
LREMFEKYGRITSHKVIKLALINPSISLSPAG